MSFDIALSGIQAINEQLTTVSNNIANAGTFGFKSSRANFSSMYAGTRPTGVEVGSLTQSIGLNGGVLNTGRGLDASINGRGFFVSRDAQNTLNYSRVGIFSASSDGYLVTPSGNKVQGYGVVTGSAALGALGDLKIPTGQIPAVATTRVEYVGNMSSDWIAKAGAFNKADGLTYNSTKVSLLYDSLGAKHTLNQYFVKSPLPAVNTVDVHYTIDDVDLATVTKLVFDTNGQLKTVGGVAATNAPVPPAVAPADYKPVFPPIALTQPVPGAEPLKFDLSFNGSTQFAGEAVTTTDSANGYASGSFTGVELADDGSVVAKYTNGEKQSVGTVALGTFPDEGSLTPIDDTSWIASTTSGTPLYDRPGTGMAGRLNTSSLEQSNVDITSELVGLMTSQRNYQANSKVISTESAMMQSLMQAL